MKITKNDCYNLNGFLAKIIYKSLKKYKKHNISVPMFLEVKHNGNTKRAAAEWDEMLDKMIFAFQELWSVNDIDFIVKYNNSKKDCNKWQSKVKEGKQLFIDHFSDLWI